MYNYKWNEKCLYNYIDVFVVFLNSFQILKTQISIVVNLPF